MKTLRLVLVICAGFVFTGTALGQSILQADEADSRRLFPNGWVRGYTEFSVAPPHNEPDLNRCSASTGLFGGEAAQCSAFARYVGSGYVELRPFGTIGLRRAFLFAEPSVFLGSNVPQFHYSASAAPMALDRSIGAGVALTRNFELRVSQHRVEWLGRYEKKLGFADLGKAGPLGQYTTVSARWYFGGYRDRR
jgi:hypothetical protein